MPGLLQSRWLPPRRGAETPDYARQSILKQRCGRRPPPCCRGEPACRGEARLRVLAARSGAWVLVPSVGELVRVRS